jgi:hypothetical protein
LSISLRRYAVAAFLVLAGAASAAQAAADRELVRAQGILARGDAVVLFTQVSQCATVSEPAVPAAQIFVSTDGGKTWSKKGPALEGKEFQYVYDTAAGLWVAGMHTLEGPADPFLLVPSKAPFEWNIHVIYEGSAALGRLAFGENRELLARIIHVDLVNDRERGYLHASSDGGRSWRMVGRAKRDYPKGLREFAEIAKQTAKWRVVDGDDGGSRIEHRAGKREPWRTVSEFVAPSCDP